MGRMAEDPAVPDQIGAPGQAWTKRRRVSGSGLCAISGLLLSIGAAMAWSIFTDPAVAGDLDGGTHTAHRGATGVIAFVLALLGVGTALTGLVRGPLTARLVAIALLLIGIPLVPVSGLATLLTNSP
jgi:hypothetical protein